jgi:hypothetical protein
MVMAMKIDTSRATRVEHCRCAQGPRPSAAALEGPSAASRPIFLIGPRMISSTSTEYEYDKVGR